MGNILNLLSKYVSKTTFLIILTVCASVFGVFSASEYFVTAQELEMTSLKLKNEDEKIKNDLEQKIEQQELEVLYLQQRMQQQQVWDLDSRIEDIDDQEKKEKWERRLKRAEIELKVIDSKIEKIKDK